MMASVFLSNLIGLVREMVIAYVRGAGQEVDAYQLSFLIPEILNHILASGFLSITFIPIFSRYLSEENESQGWQVFSIILTNFGILLVFFICIAEVFAADVRGSRRVERVVGNGFTHGLLHLFFSHTGTNHI